MPTRGRPVLAACRRPTRAARVLLLAVPLALTLVLAVAAQEGTGPSGTIDDGGLRVIQWQLTGMDVGQHSYSGGDRCWTGPVTVTSDTVTFSGVLKASVPADLVTTASMSAYLYNASTREKQEVVWPDAAAGESGDLGKPGELSHELAFSFTVHAAPGQAVWATANVSECGGICDLTALCLFSEPAPDTLVGAPTETPAAATAEPEAGDSSWVGLVVGVGAVGAVAVAGVAAVAAVALRSRGKRAQRVDRRYILQLSVDRIELAPGETKPLAVTAWRVTPEGGYTPAPEANIQVLAPPGLTVAPTTAAGNLQCSVTAQQTTSAGELRLRVLGTAAGAAFETSVAVVVADENEVEIF